MRYVYLNANLVFSDIIPRVMKKWDDKTQVEEVQVDEPSKSETTRANPLTGQAIVDTSALNPKNGGIALLILVIVGVIGFVWYKKKK